MFKLPSLDQYSLTPDALCCTHQATRLGDQLLEDSGCGRCSPETGGIGAAAVELVRMVDVGKDRGVSGSTLGCVSAAAVSWCIRLCCWSTTDALFGA